MASIASKKSGTPHLVVAILFEAATDRYQFGQTSWQRNSSTDARKIVESLSDSEARLLPKETRERLLQSLKAGRITQADSKAINKLLSCELTELEYQQRIVIKGAADFISITKTHLNNLSLIPIGRKLLSSLYKSGKQVLIVPSDRVCEAPPDNFKAAILKGRKLKWFDLSGKEKTIKGTGLGSDTTIKYNPSFSCSNKGADWQKSPPEIALAHELIHADDSAYGRLDPDEIGGIKNYERQAVGLLPYEDKEFTENKFRAAWVTPIPLRTKY